MTSRRRGGEKIGPGTHELVVTHILITESLHAHDVL